MNKRVKAYTFAFAKRLYAFLILFASDPFDLIDRWTHLDYSPPSWLFWVLLAIAFFITIWLTIRDVKKKESQLPLLSIPMLLNQLTKRLKQVVKKENT